MDRTAGNRGGGPDDADHQYGTLEHAHQAHRRDFQANPIDAVVDHKWQGKNDGPGEKMVFLTNAPGVKPLQPFDDYNDRSLIENYWIKEVKQQWELGHSPQKNERAVRVHVAFTLLMFALATAYRLQCEREASGGGPSADNVSSASSWSRPATR